MQRMRVCACISCSAHPDSCPQLTTDRRCPDCAGVYERRRGTRQERGYDRTHDDLREQWRPRVEAGYADCRAPICLMPQRRILPDQAWDLGHDGQRRHRGPEHARCNRSAGGKAAHRG